MKLAHYQIEHIREWIDMQNIWYDEIKDELLDHIVCSVEAKMASNDIRFVDALAEVCLEVNPSEMQRQKLRVEHIHALKQALMEMKDFSPWKLIAFGLMTAILIALQSFPYTNDPSSTQAFMTINSVLIFIFGGIYTYRFRQQRPFSNVYIFSRMNGIYLVSFLYASIPPLLIEGWLMNHPIQSFIYAGTQFWFTISGIKVLFDSFNKLKNATH